MHSFRKMLINTKEFNPFHDHYNPQDLIEYIHQCRSKSDMNETDIQLTETAASSKYFNDIYIGTREYLKETIIKNSITLNEVFKYSLFIANRSYLAMQQKFLEDIKIKNYYSLEDGFRLKVDSLDSSIGKVDAQTALEVTIESINILFNFARIMNHSPNIIGNTNNKTIEDITRLFLASSNYFTFKDCYESCIWNDGFIDLDKKNKKVNIQYNKPEQLVLQRIGSFRLQNISQTNFIQIKQYISKHPDIEEQIRLKFREKKKPKRIKNVSFDKENIVFKLAKGIDKNEFDYELRNYCYYLAYYNFMKDINLPQLSGLSLNDLIILFDTLRHLFRNLDDDEMINHDIENTPYIIAANSLKEYLSQRTTYNRTQINQFLELLSNKENKPINFWHYPLLKNKSDYLFPLLAICAPISLVLYDTWLEDSGFSLDRKGIYFERYIKDELRTVLNEKKYKYYIPSKNDFVIKNQEHEEIDLIINLKSICIIAEIKCIKLPFNARDEHNAIKRITAGAKQVIRKTKFIIENLYSTPILGQ
jgi:hypothetical protein